MSRIGKKPIKISDAVITTINQNVIICKGPKGELKHQIHPMVKVEKNQNNLFVTVKNKTKDSKSLHGLTRQLISNMLIGVTERYTKELEIIGVGYRAALKGKNLELVLGYSHPITYITPDGIEIKLIKNKILINGIDKQQVGQVAAQIRAYKKPEPYKGKGIRYVNEQVKRKAGKTAKSSGSASA